MLFILFSLVALYEAQNCPNGATYVGQPMNTCLLGMPDKTFYKAEMTCMQQGGHLVTIANAFQNTAVLNFTALNFCCGVWIGMDQSGFWQDGTKEGYTNFAPHEPKPDFRCVQIDQNQGGRWVSANCTQRTDFICSLPPKTTNKCLSGWSHYAKTNFCYKTMNDHPNLDWAAADLRCKAFGANLASVHSREENHFMAVLASSSLSRGDLADQTWTGLKVLDKNMTKFQWSDGTAVDYKNFAVGEPNGQGNEQCIMMITDFNFDQRPKFSQWYDHFCNTKMNSFMCKMRPSAS